MICRLLVASLLLLSLATGGALGQSREQPPILFSADEVQTDEELGLVVAKGHVQISQGLQTLLADVVTYNRHTDTITASGNVSLQQPTGEVVFGDFMELSDRFDNGFIQNIRVLLSDRSRLAANTGRRTGGVHTELRRGVYSPCDLCKEDPSRPPLWQLRAEKIIHDQETHLIEYEDVVMEVGGFPVFYSPYLSHPDPTIKRQSGFLVPTVGNSTSLGAHATIPYYWAIAPDRDITFSPIFTSSQGVVADAEYRQRYSNGILQLEGSLNNGTSPDNPSQSAIRGHVNGLGRWNINDNWRSGFDLQRASDQTYERLFHFGGTQNFLTSRGFAERFDARSFLAANSYTFQTLRQGTSDSNQPIVTPVMDYNWIGEPDRFGGRLNAQADLLNLNRLRGPGSHRLSAGTGWSLPFNGLVGDVFTFSVSSRGDIYSTTDLALTSTDAPQNFYVGRVYPQAGLQWRYPWVRQGERFAQSFEPIVAVFASPNGLNPAKISNEDSNAFDFSDAHLFVPNRFAGLDRVDSSDRVDYGLRASIIDFSTAQELSMLIGQSYRLQNNGVFAPGSGLENKLSDIVGRFVLTPSNYFSAIYRYRLGTNLSLKREEVTVSGGPPKLRLAVSYIKLPPDLLANDTGNRNQIALSAGIGLSHYWTLALATTRNLTGELGTVSSGVVATYQDECLGFIASLTQSGTSDRDVKPGAALVFSVVFKNLGEISFPAFNTAGVR